MLLYDISRILRFVLPSCRFACRLRLAGFFAMRRTRKVGFAAGNDGKKPTPGAKLDAIVTRDPIDYNEFFNLRLATYDHAFALGGVVRTRTQFACPEESLKHSYLFFA